MTNRKLNLLRSIWEKYCQASNEGTKILIEEIPELRKLLGIYKVRKNLQNSREENIYARNAILEEFIKVLRQY